MYLTGITDSSHILGNLVNIWNHGCFFVAVVVVVVVFFVCFCLVVIFRDTVKLLNFTCSLHFL